VRKLSGYRLLCRWPLGSNAGYLKKEWFAGKERVGITAGASAPEVLVQEVVDTVHGWGFETVREGEGEEESIVFVLPKELRG